MWNKVAVSMPENRVLDTRINDERGIRNEQQLIRRGNLFWHPDGSTYIYYTPTEWKYPS